MSGRRPREDFRFDARYGRLIRKAGIGTVPFAIFYYQAELDLTPQEVWLIAYVLAHRWTSELPFPAVREMSRRSGLTTKTIQKYKKGLEEKGYLNVIRRTRADGGNTSIGWDFSPLFEKVDRLITRDIESWVRRNPQFLEEELPGLEGELGDNFVDNPPPVIRGYHGPRVRGSHGGEEDGSPGAAVQGSHGPSTLGNTHDEEDEIYEETNAGTDSVLQVKRGARQPRTATSSSSKAGQLSDGDENDPGLSPPPASPLIDSVVRDYSARLHDAPKSVRANCTRARRLWERSGLAEDDFVGLLHTAYERTQENAHRIRKAAKDGPYGTKNKMPYFFSVLVSLVEAQRDGDD